MIQLEDIPDSNPTFGKILFVQLTRIMKKSIAFLGIK